MKLDSSISIILTPFIYIPPPKLELFSLNSHFLILIDPQDINSTAPPWIKDQFYIKLLPFIYTVSELPSSITIKKFIILNIVVVNSIIFIIF